MNFAPQDTAAMTLSEIYPDLLHGFGGTAFTAAIVWAALFYGAVKIDKMKREKSIAALLTCFLVAVIWVMGKSFSIDNTLHALYSSYVQIVKTILYTTGIAYLLFQLSFLYDNLLNVSAAGDKTAATNFPRIRKLYDKHPFAGLLLVLLVGMLPHLLLSYPTRMSFDARNQLGYYFGLWPFSSHHPPFSSWMMGKVVSFGMAVSGSGNLGVFLYCVIQYLALALVTAYLIYTLKVYLHAPEWLQVSTLLITLISPYHAAMVGVMLKDLLYSYCLLLFIIEMAYILAVESPDRKHLVLLSISGILTILLRNNGKYVIYPALLALGLFVLCKSKAREKVVVWMAAVSIIVCSIAAEGYFQQCYVQEKGSIAEALSLFFQQTARYVKEYEDEITPEERESIAKILDYDNLGSIYDPEISDPVKWTYNSSATGEDLKAYMQTWLQQFLKHPWCYVEATLNQNYFLFYPAELYAYFADVIDDTEMGKTLAAYLNIHEVESGIFRGLATLQELYVGTMLMIPVIGMFSNVGFYNLLLLFLIIYALREKCFKTVIMAVPLLFTDLVVVAAPYVGPRYVFPVIYSMPCIIAFYIAEKRRRADGEDIK